MTRTFKIVLLGAAAVGKSALALRFFRDEWSEKPPPPTIGAAFMARQIDLDDETVHINLWDTAGAERYLAVSPMYVRGSDAVIICYDLSRSVTVEDAGRVVRMVLREVSNPLIFMVGCKRDIARDPCHAPEDLRLAATDETIRFVSSKRNQGVKELFNAVIRGVANRRRPGVPVETVSLEVEEIPQRCCF